MILKPMYGMDGSGESVRFFKGPIHSHSQAKRNWDLSWVTRDGAKRRVRARAHCSSALSVSTNVTSHDTSTTAWVPTPSGVWSAHYCHEEPWSAASSHSKASSRPRPRTRKLFGLDHWSYVSVVPDDFGFPAGPVFRSQFALAVRCG